MPTSEHYILFSERETLKFDQLKKIIEIYDIGLKNVESVCLDLAFFS